MRILILSDLHLEVWRDAPTQAQELLSTVASRFLASQPDLVVIAGDIDVGDRAVAWAHQVFRNLSVIYVHGNHEAYEQKIDTLKGKLAQACSATGHIHLLDRCELVIGNVRFLGVPLCTDFQLPGTNSVQESMQSASAGMNDDCKVRLARAGHRKIKPLDVAQWHWEERAWLQQRLAEPFNGSTVVLTHMGPSSQSIPERYKGHALAAAYASHLDSLVCQADLWIHGHIHDSMDYLLSGTRVVCNPLGYPLQSADGHWLPENTAFDPSLVVEVGTLPPARQILQNAEHQRQALVSHWFSAAEVSARLGKQFAGSSEIAGRLRREGQLLAVYVTRPAPSYRYPPWQFRADGKSVDHLAEILAVLRDFGPFDREPDELRRTTGWGEVEWFMSPHVLLDGATPATMLGADPARVLRAARAEFEKEV